MYNYELSLVDGTFSVTRRFICFTESVNCSRSETVVDEVLAVLSVYLSHRYHRLYRCIPGLSYLRMNGFGHIGDDGDLQVEQSLSLVVT